MTNGTNKLYGKFRIPHKLYIYQMRGRACLTKLVARLAARTPEVNCGICGGQSFTERSGIASNFVRGEGGSTNSVEDRGQTERGSGSGSPLVRGSGGSCNLVQEISIHIVKFS